VRTAIMRMRFEIANDAPQQFEALMQTIDAQMDALAQE
jgi:hypothetical protein